MSDEACPFCGSKKRRIRHNKWHVREVFCANCWRCLNVEEVRRRTGLAEMAAREGKLDEFYMGTYEPSQGQEDPGTGREDEVLSEETEE
ncbi:MAG: hypothetical protein ACP6KW_12185 [Candidatus Thorarchaeota archaeon]